MLVRMFAAETVTTKVKVNLIAPGQVRTRLLTAAMPNARHDGHHQAGQGCARDRGVCLPGVTETGKIYDLPAQAVPGVSAARLSAARACHINPDDQRNPKNALPPQETAHRAD